MVLRWAIAPGSVLEVRAERRGAWSVEVVRLAGGECTPVPVPRRAHESVAWTVEREQSLYHLDITGVVSATLAAPRDRAEARCLFAATPLIRALGIPGGRYELLSASLISA
jgi:hypothetical protein